MNNNITLVCDTRQKSGKHDTKEKYFKDNGIKTIRSKLPFGDYALLTNMSRVVDTKFSCGELYQDLIQDHERFHNECVNSKEYGIELIILVENEFGFKEPKDILNYDNPQYKKWFMLKRKFEKAQIAKLPKQPASNQQLLKIMCSMTSKYGVKFLFCKPSESAKKIIELLGGDNNK